MSEINVTYTKHSLRKNSFSDLGQAILHAGNDDTVIIHRKKNYLDKNWKCIPINKSIYIEGANPKSMPTIYVKNHQIALGITAGNIHLKNVNIELSAQAVGIETSMNYQGNLELDNVHIQHDGKIAPREYDYGFLVWGSGQQFQLYANVVLTNCQIDYALISSLYLTMQNTCIGRLDGKQSQLVYSAGQSAGVELTHTKLENISQKQTPLILHRVTTVGMLHLVGNIKIHDLTFYNGIQQPDHPLGGLFSNPKKLLAEYQIPSDMPLVYTDSLPIQNIVSAIQITDLHYDPALLRVRPQQALVRPYTFNFNQVHMTVAKGTIAPNYLGTKNITTGGSLMLEDINDKSHWKDLNTTTGRKGSTQSELFSTLPTGSEIHANVAVDPVAQLDNLIGLTKAKKVIKKIIASAIVNRYNIKHSAKGIPSGKKYYHMPMHTVLEGPAGTGKTTVAKLIWRILYKRGVVGSNFIHIDGNDLKGSYQGQTAPKVERIVNKAIGGVLFIDEAYGLVGGKKGGGDEFSQEAISTLTDELEEHQHDMMCIMAGYTYEMQQLLDSNEGLHSRFMHIIQFPNYTSDQMVKILELMMKKEHQQTSDNDAALAMSEGLKTVLDAKKGSPEGNGNARTARNYLTAVTNDRDARIVYHNPHGINNSNRRIITAEDARDGANDMVEKEQAEG